MSKRVLRLAVALTAVLLMVMTGSALAGPYPTISALAVCDPATGAVVINYTSAASEISIRAENPRIDILVNGVAVASGAYASPTYSFSGVTPAPASAGPGDSIVVTALAVGNWVYFNMMGGQSASTTVTIPTDPCTQPGLGRFTGGGSQISVGIARITRGLTIHPVICCCPTISKSTGVATSSI